MWIDESAFMSVREARAVKRGRPQVYSDAMIQAVLTLKHVYHLTLRASQGLVQRLCGSRLRTSLWPNYTTLSRRAQALQVTLPEMSSGGLSHHAKIVGSRGLRGWRESAHAHVVHHALA